jgi:hypothetical protein
VKKNSSVVYSTDPDYQSTCPACLERMNACRCAPKSGSFRNPNPVEIRRETKGRGGKAVTVVMQAGGDLKARTQRPAKTLRGWWYGKAEDYRITGRSS